MAGINQHLAICKHFPPLVFAGRGAGFSLKVLFTSKTTHHLWEVQKSLYFLFIMVIGLQIDADGLTFKHSTRLYPPLLVLAHLRHPIC